MKESWIEKFNQPKEMIIKVLEKDFSDMKAGEVMLVATPKIIDEYINHVPKSYVTNVKTMRKDLAFTYQADVTCPVKTGIFLRVVSEASFEKIILGGKTQLHFGGLLIPNQT